MVTDAIDTSPPTKPTQIHEQLGRKYEAGFITDIESDSLPPGLAEDIIRALSAKKDEPEWMTEWRLAAYRHFLTMPMPDWAKLQIAPIDLQALSYYSAPKAEVRLAGRRAAGTAGHLRQAGRAAARTRQAGRRGRGCGVRLGQRRHHLPQGTGREGRDLLLDVRSHARSTRTWSSSTWAAWCRPATTISPR